jgi:hypothetical protein
VQCVQGETEWGPCFTPKDEGKAMGGFIEEVKTHRSVVVDFAPSEDTGAYNRALADKDFACIVP